MKKKNIGITASVLATVLLLASIAFAHTGSAEDNAPVSSETWGMMGTIHQNMGVMHEQMEELMEGTYSDLEALREEEGSTVMPWVTDEESFKAMQEHHATMHPTDGETSEEHKMPGNMMNGMMNGFGMFGERGFFSGFRSRSGGCQH